MHSLLSGAEIIKAYHRQQEYSRLSLSTNWFDRLRLRRLKNKPRLYISAFDELPTHKGGSIGPNSYDLRLSDKLKVYEFGCLSDCGPGKLPPFLNMAKETPTREITIGADGIILSPGCLYLGCTVEHTETYNLAPYIDGRSSMARLGCALHITAGAGDRGFAGRFTLEITVVHPLKIYANAKVAQIRYHTIGPGWDYQGRYQNAPAEPVASLFSRPIQSIQGKFAR